MKLNLPALLLLFFLFTNADAQIGLQPLKSNPQIAKYLKDHPDYAWNTNQSLNKWGKGDTLDLPFFEDFSQHHIYPDSSRWLDNRVFINSDIPIRPPSYGAATFDFLDQHGNPYANLEKDRVTGSADTLTSQFLNMGGLNALDTVIMTFYYQPIGLGDFSTNRDSLHLLFKAKDSTWRQVWSVGGGAFSEFIKVVIPIDSSLYLYSGFQFRFVNTTFQWGNNNHWHVDYIYIDKDRSLNDLDFPDQAVQARPTSLLKNYFSMPYAHFMVDPNGESADSIYFRVANRSSSDILAEVRHRETWKSTVLVSTSFPDNVDNLAAEGDALRRFRSYDFSGLTGDTVVIKRDYYVREASLVNPFLYRRNDSISIEQRFENYFAMDDGTAESSFGFNDLKNATGNMAVRFTLNMDDTLRAVRYFFTPNVDDPSKYLITLKIWKDIEFDGGTTELVWDSTILLPDFRLAGFGEMMVFLGAIPLSAGDFYIGWEQQDNFNISIGFDKNNGYRNGNQGANPDIFYHVGGDWIQNTNNKLAGAPMIRAYVGADFKPVAIGSIQKAAIQLYPNPARDVIHIRDMQAEKWRMFDLTGKQVLGGNQMERSGIDVSSLDAGIYILSIYSDNAVLNEKVLIQR